MWNRRRFHRAGPMKCMKKRLHRARRAGPAEVSLLDSPHRAGRARDSTGQKFIEFIEFIEFIGFVELV
jgi:hypothetical protein